MSGAKSFGNFVLHVLRRLPSVIRERRFPYTWDEVRVRARWSYSAFANRSRLRNLPSRSSRNKKGIFFLSHNLNAEGAPRSLFALARGLSDKYDVLVFSMAPGPLGARFKASGIPVTVANPLWGATDEESYERALALLEQGGRKWGIDLVFCNTLRCFWGVTLARRLGVPSIWCIRESVDWRGYFDHLPWSLPAVATHCLKQADRLLFVAGATRKLFSPFEGNGRLLTIHNGIELGDIQRFKVSRSRAVARRMRGIGEDESVVSIIGTTCERKGQIDFLRAARALRDGGRNLRFLVVGARPSDYQAKLERYVSEHRLTSVQFVDETPDVYDYFRSSDVFVCSSYQESFPRVVLEAMAFELPIVCTNVYGIPEMLMHGESGLLVPPGDAEALTEGIAKVLDDPSLARRLSENAFHRVQSEFAMDRMIAGYERLFDECLASDPGEEKSRVS